MMRRLKTKPYCNMANETSKFADNFMANWISLPAMAPMAVSHFVI